MVQRPIAIIDNFLSRMELVAIDLLQDILTSESIRPAVDLLLPVAFCSRNCCQ